MSSPGRPTWPATFRNVFPSFDITTAGGFLQLLAQLEFIVTGFAASTLVAGWASDEASGRLEMLLATPLTRGWWAVRSGMGVFLAIALMTAVLAVAVGIGAVVAGSDAVTPMAGSTTLGLYAAAAGRSWLRDRWAVPDLDRGRDRRPGRCRDVPDRPDRPGAEACRTGSISSLSPPTWASRWSATGMPAELSRASSLPPPAWRWAGWGMRRRDVGR